MHFVVPETYERIVPKSLGRPRKLPYVSGVLEVVAGGLLAMRRTRRVGGWLAAAVLVAIFPANIKMAVDGGAEASARTAVLWLRLPLQVPLVAWAVQQARAVD